MANQILTARFCETVKPPATGRAEYRDAALPGFRFRVTARGKRSFSLVYRGVDRRQRRLTWAYPGYKLAEARTAAEAALRAVGRGENPETEKRAAKAAAVSLPGTVGDLCDRYVEQHLKKNVRRWEAAEGELENHIKPHLGALGLGEIERGHVRGMLAAIEPEYPVAANRALQRLRAMFNWAIEQDLATTNPTVGIKKPTKEKPRSRTLSDDELAAMWHACAGLGYPAQQFVRMLILTGQRRDDVRLMHWSEIDLDRRDWTIPAERYKGDRAHLIPLTEAMAAMLEDMPFRDRAGYVFSPSGGAKPYGNVVRTKREIDKAAGVTGWTLHDLRRTLRTGLSRLGVRPDISERAIGHAVGGALGQVYDTHEYRAEKLDALQAWGAHVTAAVEGQAAENVVALRSAVE